MIDEVQRSRARSRPGVEHVRSRERTRGCYWDEIVVTRKDGSVDRRTTEVRSNLIVNTLPILLAALMKGEGGYSGILYHAIGEGVSSWDTADPRPTPEVTDATLEAEHFRKTPDSITFRDENGDVSVSPTNIIRIETLFQSSVPGVGGRFCREQGLVGGNATATLDSGLLVNKIHHGAIWLPSDADEDSVDLRRFIQIVF